MASNRQKKASGGETGGSLLQMMTISLFIILLAFFILLNSIAVVNDQKVTAAIGSLLGSFKGLTGGYAVIEGSGDTPRLIAVQTESGLIDFSDLFVSGENWSQEIKIKKNSRGTVVDIPARDLFEPFGFELKPSAEVLLGRLCRLLRENDHSIEIIGHTDNLPMEDDRRTTNRELSTLRAVNVLRYFVTVGKLAPQRLLAYGWGSYRPAYPNTTEDTRRMNRRIEILVIHENIRPKPKDGFTFKRFFFRTFD